MAGSFLFAPLYLLPLLASPSLGFSLKNCSVQFSFSPEDVTVLCGDRRLDAVPDDIPRAAATGLELDHNEIAKIQKRDLKGLFKVGFLKLNDNCVTHIEDGSFSDMTSLKELVLSANRLTNLSAGVFEGLGKLETLNAELNLIEHISALAFTPLANLKTLIINRNFLMRSSNLIPLLNLPNLQYLDVDLNYLTTFESEDFPLMNSSLTQLSLDNNPLEKFSVTSDMFPNLESVRLDSGSVEVQWNVPNKRFLQSLKSLTLCGNMTSETFRQIFESVDNLRYLRLISVTERFQEGLVDFACQIPALRSLKIDQNVIPFVNGTLLRSCAELRELDLSIDQIMDMTQDSLSAVRYLSILNLNVNRLTSVPSAVRGLSELTSLSLSQNDIGRLDCQDFRGLVRLRRLYLISNRISKLRGCVFRQSPRLVELQLQGNPIDFLDCDFGPSLSNLILLFMARNKVWSFERGDFRNMSSLYRFDSRSLTTNYALEGPFEGLDHLGYLMFSPASLHKGLFDGLKNLESLTVNLPRTIPAFSSGSGDDLPFERLSSLRELTILCSCTDLSLPPNLLRGLDSLLSFTAETVFDETPHVDTFKYTPNLLVLKIIKSNVSDPKPEMFHPIPQLQHLDLSENKLRSLDFLGRANLSALRRLELRLNEITAVNALVFQSLPALTYLDLTGNLFSCDCSNLGFMAWVVGGDQTQVVDAFQYRCVFPPSLQGTALMAFDLQSCFLDASFLCFACSSSLVSLTLLCAFVHHFLRLQLVYALYLLRALVYDRRRRRRAAPCRYDAFVSYNVKDEAWVCEQLLPELEGGQGWRLCLHHRDFQPGKAIMENITDAIYSSRKTLCVISRSYLHSEWCSQEIQMASFRLFDEQKDVLVLLFLEEVRAEQLAPFFRMRKFLRSRTYLSWPQNRQNPGLFWEKVRLALESGERPESTSALPVLNQDQD